MTKKQEIPSHLSKEAGEIFRDLCADYRINDTAGLKILRVACEAFERAQGARIIIDRDGMTVKDKFEQTKPHPLLPIERDSRAAFLSGLKALNLDITPPRDQTGRPRGK